MKDVAGLVDGARGAGGVGLAGLGGDEEAAGVGEDGVGVVSGVGVHVWCGAGIVAGRGGAKLGGWVRERSRGGGGREGVRVVERVPRVPGSRARARAVLLVTPPGSERRARERARRDGRGAGGHAGGVGRCVVRARSSAPRRKPSWLFRG